MKETKGSSDPEQLRSKEYSKLRCGEAHFKVLDVAFEYGPGAGDL
ncbi:MAG: hypothetical protein ACRD21_19090 [Vicinamibacteria bacterium]